MELHICSLPAEILLKIFSVFDARGLLGIERVCHQWEQISNTPLLWKNLCTKKQKGAAELISYKLSKVESIRKRKREPICNWKKMYFHYSSFSWFLDGKCTKDLLSELELAILQMLDLVNDNSPTNPSELVWLHSVVYSCCVKAINQISLQPVLDLYRNAVMKKDQQIIEQLQEVSNQQVWLEKVVQAWKSHSRYVDLLFTFFRPIDRKLELFEEGENLKSFARHTYLSSVFIVFKTQILEAAESLSDSQEQEANTILAELYKMFSFFGEPFLGSDTWEPPQQVLVEEKEKVRTGWRFSSSDELVFTGAELTLMSPVLRDIMSKQ